MSDIIEQARQLLASLEALSMPDTQVAALCRALIVRTEALRFVRVYCDDALDTGSRDFREWVDDVQEIRDAARRALADEPHTGQGD